MLIRLATEEDAKDLLQLHQAVAQNPGGIIRTPNEITADYIASVLAEREGKVLGEIHAYALPLRAFRHSLADLTIVVHPNAQGEGIGLKTVNPDFDHRQNLG